MKTEAEAKQTWCHKSMGAAKKRKCVASECMAWRWHDLGKKITELDRSRLGTAPESGRIVYANRAVGFCGSAGIPIW